MMDFIKQSTALVLFSLFSAIQIKAQDVMTIHMKDGSVISFENGRHMSTNIRFWENTPEQSQIIGSKGNYEYVIENYNHEYAVMIKWDKNYPIPTDVTRFGLCVGVNEDLNIDNCEKLIDAYADNINGPYYFQLAAEDILKEMKWTNYFQNKNPLTITNIPLKKGQTYYCRIVSRTPYLQGGQRKESIVYGSQILEFRIPLLMADSKIVPENLCGVDIIYPDTSAWTAFYQKYFPETPIHRLSSLGRLWTKWIANHKTEVSVCQQLTFDDGVLHLVNNIPDEFYTWITTREIVFNKPENIQSIDKGFLQEIVINVDEKWQVPGNSYMRFSPRTSTDNTIVVFDAFEIIPGLPYLLEVVFAPETYEQYIDDQRPTKLFIEGIADDGNKTTIGESEYLISASEVTRLSFKDPISDFVNLAIKLKITARQTPMYQRVIRLAEIRLKPADYVDSH